MRRWGVGVDPIRDQDIRGLLLALERVRPELRPVLQVSRKAHSRARHVRSVRPLRRDVPAQPRRLTSARRVQIDEQARCPLGHWQGDRPCRGCRGR